MATNRIDLRRYTVLAKRSMTSHEYPAGSDLRWAVVHVLIRDPGCHARKESQAVDYNWSCGKAGVANLLDTGEAHGCVELSLLLEQLVVVFPAKQSHTYELCSPGKSAHSPQQRAR